MSLDGAAHYAEADRLLAEAAKLAGSRRRSRAQQMVIARAQVHANLAAVAAAGNLVSTMQEADAAVNPKCEPKTVSPAAEGHGRA